MQFTNTLAVATSLIAAVSGAAVPQLITRQNNGTTNGTAPGLPADAKFQLMALRSASEVHFSTFQAAKSSIFLQLPNQNATCDSTEDDDSATFYLNQDDGGLYLYAASATPQQLYADRSGMGQGKLGYTTGAQPAPRNGERSGWKVDQYGDLTLDGASFLACPNSIEDSWSVWVSSGVANPAGNSDCLGIAVRAVQITDPNSCSYTS
ncbi:cell wall protein PhiA [Colletotrichum godetiae]|uniref:Cell wall protein PhiA n=2 Tax=Colletotrichum acutatum species complex TaxID=2707335 RepID=A0A135V0E7_9PEZI|nr:cell wall protein PhiA [Colletotrichum godetiae]KAK1673435.1 cell wall protein PhiA [Colletotrichum godetiae]KXH66133.1 cell wall protein PhiA [Colletotrichum salicis]